METKRCFKCGIVKPLNEFYKHSKMKDGHLNKCKECTEKDSTNHRNANIEKCRAYDRKRGNRETKEKIALYKVNSPNKYKAHALVNNGIRAGKLTKGGLLRKMRCYP